MTPATRRITRHALALAAAVLVAVSVTASLRDYQVPWVTATCHGAVFGLLAHEWLSRRPSRREAR
ncbi:hypothetical protein [Streptomyces sp. NPDC049879]|uniref:hypothetical protein n=1 Tax=Streptomyces sp. NPDC049879 TaxID=3365598 RepID=UPI0037905DDD